MTTPMITWSVIVALVLIVLAVRIAGLAFHRRHVDSAHRHLHIINVGSEAEEFYVPGDNRREDPEAEIDKETNPDYDI